MPLKEYLYHGHAVGFEADIWDPVQHKVDGHARCGVSGNKSGDDKAREDQFELEGVIGHGGCHSSVTAMGEDKDGFFRTEVRATLNNLNVENGVLLADQITLGMVSVYRRHWFDNGKPHGTRARVLPFDCKIVNLRLNGKPVEDLLPPPFHYSDDRRESYLYADEPDPAVDDEIRKAITGSSSRLKYHQGFGRIYFGEWTLIPGTNWHPIHQIHTMRLALGSPQSGTTGGPGGQNDGGGTGT